MTTPTAPRNLNSRPRTVRFTLRDGGILVADLHLADGQAIAPFLSSRKGGWLNLTNATWAFEGVRHAHAVLQDDDIAWASSSEPDVRVNLATPNGETHEMDFLLDDRSRLRGSIVLAARQRLSDYLAACGRFIPVLAATMQQKGEALGDIALNGDHVKAVRHASALEAGADAAAAAQAVWQSTRRRIDTRGIASTEGDAVEEATPTPAFRPEADAESTGPILPPLSPVESERVDRLNNHWLVRIVRSCSLLPPDPRLIGDQPGLAEVWSSIAKRNYVSDAELCVPVSMQLKLALADLASASAEAMRIVPAKVALKLGIVPLRVDSDALTVAASDPGSIEIEQQLRFLTRLKLRFEVAAPKDIDGALAWYYAPGAGTAPRSDG